MSKEYEQPTSKNVKVGEGQLVSIVNEKVFFSPITEVNNISITAENKGHIKTICPFKKAVIINPTLDILVGKNYNSKELESAEAYVNDLYEFYS